MSIIISIMRIPEGINSLNDLPDEFKEQPLGSHAEVMGIIKSLFPDADFSDSTWISVSSDQVREVILGVEDPVYSFGLRNPSWGLIQAIFERFGWRGLDPSNGQIIPPFIPPEYYGFSANES